MTESTIPESSFNNIPEDQDTRVPYRKEVRVGNLTALHEIWNWDGFWGESLIFRNVDVESLDDAKIEALVTQSAKVKDVSQITIKRSDSGYTFVNFNFETSDL